MSSRRRRTPIGAHLRSTRTLPIGWSPARMYNVAPPYPASISVVCSNSSIRHKICPDFACRWDEEWTVTSQRPEGLPTLTSQSAFRLSITTSRWVSSSKRSRKSSSSSRLSSPILSRHPSTQPPTHGLLQRLGQSRVYLQHRCSRQTLVQLAAVERLDL